MRLFRLPPFAAAAFAVIAPGGHAYAASPAPQRVDVAPGVVLVVVPGGLVPPGFALDDALPSPAAMAQQARQMMQQAFAGPSPERLMEVAMGEMASGPAMSGMMVTTVSDGRQSCTRQVIYAGGPGAPKMEVRLSGNGCGGGAMPAALPPAVQPIPAAPETAPRAMPRTLRVERSRAARVQVAQLDH